MFRRVVSHGQPVYDVVQAFAGPNGARVLLSMSGAPLLDGMGTVQGVVLAMEGITERRRAEQEIRRLNAELDHRVKERTAHLEVAIKELDAFAYSVSHDLRSPLRSIDGFSRALEEDCGDRLDDEGRENLRTIRAATQRMGRRLIDDMLQLSRHARAPLHRVPLDLSAMAEAISNELRAHDPGRHVEFVIEPGLKVDGDAGLIRASLGNLFDNAWKFTGRQGSARIEFGRTMVDEKSAFFVRDNGCGFDMAYAAKLFQPFQRLHTNGEFPGTGVGLANVQRIIRRHGGDICIEGKVGAGTTVYFTIPGAVG